MQIRTGDKVKFLNESGGGLVVRIINDKQALIQIEDGFEIPFLISELIKVESAVEKRSLSDQPEKKLFQTSSSQKQKTEKPAIILQQKVADIRLVKKPLFAFVPVSERIDFDNARFDLCLINDGDYYLFYIVSFEKDKKLRVIDKGELEPEMKVSLGKFDYRELLAFDAVVLDILFYADNEFEAQNPIHNRINLKSLNLLLEGLYAENDYIPEHAYIMDLLKENSESKEQVAKVTEKKDKSTTLASEKVKQKNKDIEEVDLHIEEIVEKPGELSETEILRKQMAKFSDSLEAAIEGNVKKIVFIHGVGNGKLRYELRKTLESKYNHLQFHDASFAEYGYGATMVVLKK
jgi:hypothetical protein